MLNHCHRTVDVYYHCMYLCNVSKVSGHGDKVTLNEVLTHGSGLGYLCLCCFKIAFEIGFVDLYILLFCVM